jgi:AmiR/NasT family two-component response regulator
MRRMRVDEAAAYQALQRKASDCDLRLVEAAREVLLAEEVFQGLGGG